MSSMKLSFRATGTVFERDIDDTPGPNRYRREDVKMNQRQTPSLSMSFRMKEGTRGKESPAANAFHPKYDQSHKKEPVFTMRMRTGQSFIDVACRQNAGPGVGKIDLRPKSAKDMPGARAQSMSWRPKYGKKESSPGPLDYKVQYGQTKQKAPAFSIKSCATLASVEAKGQQRLPGPSTYNKDRNALKKSGAGEFAHEFTRSRPQSAAQTPGPAAYKKENCFQFTTKRPQSASMGFRHAKYWTF